MLQATFEQVRNFNMQNCYGPPKPFPMYKSVTRPSCFLSMDQGDQISEDYTGFITIITSLVRVELPKVEKWREVNLGQNARLRAPAAVIVSDWMNVEVGQENVVTSYSKWCRHHMNNELNIKHLWQSIWPKLCLLNGIILDYDLWPIMWYFVLFLGEDGADDTCHC